MSLWKGSAYFSSYYTQKFNRKNITAPFTGFHVKQGNCATTLARLPQCTKTPQQLGTCRTNPFHEGELCEPCQW